MTFDIDAQCQEHRFVDDATVLPNFQDDTVKINNGVNSIQWSVLPFYNLTGGHPFGIQREELVIHPGNTGLIFLYQLWFEGTVTIARSTQFQWTVACDNGLCGIPLRELVPDLD